MTRLTKYNYQEHVNGENVRDYAYWSYNGDRILTFTTILYEFWEAWRSDCIYSKEREMPNKHEVETSNGSFANHEFFHHSKVREPGIHSDPFDNDPRTEYLIVVPKPELSQEVCEFWIDKLNKEYGKNFELRWI